MTHVTLRMIAERANRSLRAVEVDAKRGVLAVEPKTPGIRGRRVRKAAANKYLGLKYPGTAFFE